MNGGRSVVEMCGTAVVSVTVSTPPGGALLNSTFPERENVLVFGSHEVVSAVIATTEQKITKLQSVTPVPPVCEKVIVAGCVEKLVSNRM